MIRFIIFTILLALPLQAKEFKVLPDFKGNNPSCNAGGTIDANNLNYLLDPNNNFKWISMRQKNDFDYAKINRNTIKNLSYYWNNPSQENGKLFVNYLIELYADKNFAKGVAGGDGIDNAGRYQPAIFSLYFSYHALKANNHLDSIQNKMLLEMIDSRSKNLFNFVRREAPHTFNMSRCSNGGDLFGCQNHTYDVQLTRLLYGVTFEDQNHINQGNKIFEFAIDDLSEDGALWREAQRGWWSWHYYAKGLNLLTLVAEVYKSNDVDLYQYSNKNGQTFHDAVEFLLNGMEDHSVMWSHSKKNKGLNSKPQKKHYKDLEYYYMLKFNGMDGHNGWAYVYVNNFPNHPNTQRIKSLIQLQDQIEWAHEGIDLGCFYPFNSKDSDLYEQLSPNEYDTEMVTKFSWENK